MTMTPLLTGRDAGVPAWADVPELATCSYSRYERAMGTAVRITRYALRGVALPDPRYTDRDHWPVVRALRPSLEILHKGLAPQLFAAAYRQDLYANAGIIDAELAGIPLDPDPAAQRLVLLCHEDVAGAPYGTCHRTVFARWWNERTGRDVPELG